MARGEEVSESVLEGDDNVHVIGHEAWEEGGEEGGVEGGVEGGEEDRAEDRAEGVTGKAKAVEMERTNRTSTVGTTVRIPGTKAVGHAQAKT